MNILTRIRTNYSDFSKSNKKIADYILTKPNSLLNMTSQELGDRTNTSSATVVRFAKVLDLSGFESLKLCIAQLDQDNNIAIDPIVSKDDSVSLMLKKVSSLMKNTIDDLNETLSTHELADSIKMITEAEHIYCLGIGGSSLPAYDLYHKLNRSGKKCFYNFDSQMNIEMMYYVGRKDVIIAFSFSGLTKEILLAIEIAKKNQAKVIIVTKNNSSELSDKVDKLLLVSDSESLYRVGAITSIASSMVVSNLLYLGSLQHSLDNDLDEKIILLTDAVNKLGKEK
ncbi:MurR/RpiR family transcriptional regulator [Lapidilactobacillus bayanensis]|uniref:MurR/RpiR family transcriptional regulator n=1 Tax=Lapidilactobacillus bayanensis TaxID=2485998 RepID=UPI000F7876A2|nr:MurR/RpiR family transcriptional regulator [Lapidilactobacillus bayanensis]